MSNDTNQTANSIVYDGLYKLLLRYNWGPEVGPLHQRKEPQNSDYKLYGQLMQAVSSQPAMIGFGHHQRPIEVLAHKMTGVSVEDMPDAIAAAYGFETMEGFAALYKINAAFDDSRDYIEKAKERADHQIAYLTNLAKNDREYAQANSQAVIANDRTDSITYFKEELAKANHDKSVWLKTQHIMTKVENTFITYAKTSVKSSFGDNDAQTSVIKDWEAQRIIIDTNRYQRTSHENDWTPPASGLLHALTTFVSHHANMYKNTEFKNFVSVLEAAVTQYESIKLPEILQRNQANVGSSKMQNQPLQTAMPKCSASLCNRIAAACGRKFIDQFAVRLEPLIFHGVALLL